MNSLQKPAINLDTKINISLAGYDKVVHKDSYGITLNQKNLLII